MQKSKLKKWEMALALSVCITLCHGIAFGSAAAGCNWWGVIFPGLTEVTEPADMETAKLDGENKAAFVTENGYEIRFQLLNWIKSLRK